MVTIAGIQDRDGAVRPRAALRATFSTIVLIWADGGYAGRLVRWAQMVLALTVSLVETRPEHAEAVVHLAVITAVSRRPATLSEFPDAFRDDAADTRPWTALQ